MNTDHLRLFLVIARFRSLSRAAAELGLGQATVSERLRALEAEVGTPLFERQGRGVALSPAGEAFLAYAERALEVLRQGSELARAASAGQRGLVSIAVTVTSGAYLFAPALVDFQRQHPQVEVRVRSVHSWDAPGLVLDGVAQLALISGPAAHGQIEPVATFWAPLVLVAAPQHPLVAAQPLVLADLARHQALVSYWGPASRLFWERVRATLDAPAAPAAPGSTAPAGSPVPPGSPVPAGTAVPPGPWLELSPVELVKGMLVAGSGVSLVPAIAVERELAAGELVRLALAPGERLPEWEITLIRHRRRPANAAADALAETLRRVLPTLIHR